MKIFGREYGMLYSVGAQQEIAELCPERDIKRLGEYMRGKLSDAVEKQARIPIILSNWHEKAEAMKAAAEGREYVQQPLAWETVTMLGQEEFGALMGEAFAAMGAGQRRSVESDVPESEKKTESAAAG